MLAYAASFGTQKLSRVQMNSLEKKTIFGMGYPTECLYEVPYKTIKQKKGEITPIAPRL
jgi:hypothetical protein